LYAVPDEALTTGRVRHMLDQAPCAGGLAGGLIGGRYPAAGDIRQRPDTGTGGRSLSMAGATCYRRNMSNMRMKYGRSP